MRSAENYESQLWRYAFPSMFSQLLNSLFIIIDGYFVGQNLGDAGLAAINVAWPIVAIIQAVSLAIGIGGAVRMSIDMGRGDIDAVHMERAHAVLMLVAAAIIMGVGMHLAYPYLLPLLGAKEELYPLTADYISVVCVCAACQVFSTGLLPLLRGDGKTMTAMGLTVMGITGNIILDWFCIQYLHWGIKGAAIATAVSETACAVPALILLLKGQKKIEHFRIEMRRMLGILRNGISAFGLSMSDSVLIMMTNLQALKYGGTQGVAVYAVLSYVLGSVIPMVSGVGNGIQPLLGKAYGAGDWKAMGNLRRKGALIAVSASAMCSVGAFIFRAQLPVLFGAGPETSAEIASAMWTLAIAFPFMAIVRFSGSCFCALGLPADSSLLAYGEPLVVQPLFLFTLPLVLGLKGVWVSYPAAMITMSVITFVLLKISRRRMVHEV